MVSRAVRAKLANQRFASLFWCVAVLFLLPWAIDLAAMLHARIAPQTAAVVWAPWWTPAHPHAMTYWGAVMIAAFLALRSWLRAENLWDEIAVVGDVSAKLAPLIAGLLIFDFMASDLIASASLLLTGQTELPTYRPGYEHTVTTENLFGDLFSGVVAAPLFEEFAFRGLFLGCLLARGWSPLSAIALTSFVFGLTHVQYYPSGMMMVMVSGAIFGFLRVLTGGLLAPIAAHGALNFLISMIELSFPGEP